MGRTSIIIQSLKQSFMYSEKKPRDFVFRSVDSVLNESADSIMLARLTREASARAQHDAGLVCFVFNNWEITAQAVMNAMLSAGVLLSPEGTPVAAGVTSQAALIAGLKPEFRNLTEAFLLEHIIRRVGDVGPRDHKALAHALFRQFDRSISMDDCEDRVAVLIATLVGSIELSSDGVYRPKPAYAPSTVFVMR